MRCTCSAGVPGLDVEAVRQRRWDEYRGDFLMNLNDTQAEQVLDQREDRAFVALQQPADRGERAVDVVLGAAQRGSTGPAAFGLPETPDGQPLLAARQPGPGRQLVVDR